MTKDTKIDGQKTNSQNFTDVINLPDFKNLKLKKEYTKSRRIETLMLQNI